MGVSMSLVPSLQPPTFTASEVSLRNSSPIGGKISPNRGQISPACAQRVVSFLRAQHPVKTAEEIEAATLGRVSAATAKKWLAGASSPSFFGCFALIAAYGPQFLTAVMEDAPSWLANASRQQKLSDLEAEQARIAQAIGKLTDQT